MNTKIPFGFDLVKKGKITLLARKNYCQKLLNLGIIYPEGKRSKTLLSNLAGEKIRIKHYFHGGVFENLFKDIFFGKSRPLRELRISEKARESGIDTSEILAVITKRIFGPFCRIELISKEISNSITLDKYFFSAKSSERTQFLGIVARAIKKMHDAGIYHNDLNLKNILVQKNREAKIFILDFDKSKIKKNLSIKKRIKNLARFNRSSQKLGVKFSEEEKNLFFNGYFEGGKGRRYFKKCFSYSSLHKFFWKFLE